MLFCFYWIAGGDQKGLIRFTFFSDDNIRMIKGIGIYAILIPVMKLVVTILSVIIVGSDGFQASVSLMEVAFGLVVLCLAQYFAYGAQLEKDVDGLV